MDNIIKTTYEVKLKNFMARLMSSIFIFCLIFCTPFVIINFLQDDNFQDIKMLLIIIVSISILMSLFNEYKFLYKIEFYSDKISLYYYTFFLGNTVQINYACSSIYILYSYPQTINTDYLIIKVAGKRIIKQYRDWGWSTEIFKDIVETYETFKLKANKDV